MIVSLANPSGPFLFLAGFEAIATGITAVAALGGALFIILELRRIRREGVSHKIRGYEIAVSTMTSPDFLSAARALQEDPGPGVAHDWFDRYPAPLYHVLGGAEIIAFLIEEEYLDEAFLMRLHGYRLSQLARKVSAIEQSRQSPCLIYWATLYPKGKALLERADQWRRHQSNWQFLEDPGNPAELW